jgi:hypothetical protein
MAQVIAFDNVGKAENNGAISLSTSFTVASGSNRLMVFVIGHNGSISSVTYAGVAATKLTSQNSANYGTLDFWYLISPATGANTVAVSGSGGFAVGTWASYTGVSQSSFPNAQSKQDPAFPPTPLVGSVTTTVANCWLIGGYYTAFTSPSGFFAGAAGTTLREQQHLTSTTEYTSGLFDSNGVRTIGSQSLSGGFTGGSPGDVANIMVSIAPASSGEGFFPLFL